MAAGREEAPSPSASCPRDPRVQCRSRGWASQLLGDYRPFLEKLGAGQPLENQGLEQALAEALWNFETAVQENITVNGQPWQESSDDLQNDADIKLLEDRLDDLIVQVASKRNQYPREVQVQVVKALKAQQKLLDCYQTTANLQKITPKPSQDLHMADLSLATKNASKLIGESFKSLSSLLEKAEGFSKVLSLQPTLEQCKLHQEIVAGSEEKQENKIDVKNLTSQVEVIPTQTAISNSILLKLKRPSCSTQECYPLQQKKISLDT
ncbi:kinetochore-associated protein NSL1 homolog [Sceloporus undulatus]|uniref:kinetochore-associated protein NSL1 homolog n=1 Tax=Sceloporus undulatus TaxID=8520 RepID=UPI001C4C1226|nr:kinetochore-associated protein NSL1 homolog [Sceloporus undulatus]